MSGKKVNTTIGITIILLAIYLIILPINIDSFKDFNRYENIVVNIIKISQYVFIEFLFIVSIVFAIANKKENGLRNSYLLFPLIILYLIIPSPFFAAIALISGLLIIYFTFKKNYVSIDSYFLFSVFLILIVILLSFIISTFFLKPIANIFQKEMERNIGITNYDEKFFEYIVPIEDDSPYINLNIKKEGRKVYGYIDNTGKTTIPFEYDFATPFYRVKAYNKEFLIAAVSKDGITEVILKNERLVMSYVSEFETYDYVQKIQEFETILKDVFKEKEIVTEISKNTTNIIAKKVSPKEKNQDYTYKYQLNDKKDILIYESEVGNPTKYIIRNRNAPYAEMKLETSNLIYDEDYLYTFRNNTIPFYDRDRNEQGWFMEDGEKITITGNAQIMDVEEDRILIKNHSKNTAYFIDYNSKVLSPIFKDVIVDGDRYLIRTMADKWIITDKSFRKIFNEEFDIVNTNLISAGIYLLANIPEELSFNEYNYVEIQYMVVTRKGHMILSQTDHIHNIYYKFEGNKNNKEDIEVLRDDLKSIQYINFGDKFYKYDEENF